MKYAPVTSAILLILGFLAWKYIPNYKIVRKNQEVDRPLTNANMATQWSSGGTYAVISGTNLYRIDLGFRSDGVMMWRTGELVKAHE